MYVIYVAASRPAFALPPSLGVTKRVQTACATRAYRGGTLARETGPGWASESTPVRVAKAAAVAAAVEGEEKGEEKEAEKGVGHATSRQNEKLPRN